MKKTPKIVNVNTIQLKMLEMCTAANISMINNNIRIIMNNVEFDSSPALYYTISMPRKSSAHRASTSTITQSVLQLVAAIVIGFVAGGLFIGYTQLFNRQEVSNEQAVQHTQISALEDEVARCIDDQAALISSSIAPYRFEQVGVSSTLLTAESLMTIDTYSYNRQTVTEQPSTISRGVHIPSI